LFGPASIAVLLRQLHAERSRVKTRVSAGLQASGHPAYREIVRVQISSDAVGYISANGGQLWVWAARPRLCCAGAPALMRTATQPPPGLTGFRVVPVPDIRLQFRPAAGTQPAVLEIAMTGGRRPRVAAYWDGCLMAMV
jgi:hypothetical protein